MVSSSPEPRTGSSDASSDSSPRITRDIARARVVDNLTCAERVAAAMKPGDNDFDATRIRAYIDIASEWRYLSDGL